jgi:hypothetical protein
MKNSRLKKIGALLALLQMLDTALIAQLLNRAPQSQEVIRIENEIQQSTASTPIKLAARGKPPSAAMMVILRQQSEALRILGGAGGLNTPAQPAQTTGFGKVLVPPTASATRMQVPCPAPAISSVNGQRAVSFSPIEPYNSYVIQGCFSGEIPKSVYLQAAQSFFPPNLQTGNSPLLTAPAPFKMGSSVGCSLAGPNRMNLVVDFPGPNPNHRPTPADPHREIDVHVPSCISGVLDQNNDVVLVVEYAGGAKAQLAGFSFFAARQTVTLNFLPPRGVVQLYGMPGIDPPSDPVYIVQLVSPLPNYSGAVIRHERGPASFKPNSDKFDLHLLVSLGFAVLEPEIVPRTLTPQICQRELPGAGNLQVQRQGSWGIQWGEDPMTFAVQYQVSLCQPAGMPLMPSSQPPVLSDATYSLRIPVEGPRGVAPWGSTSPLKVVSP